MIITIDGPSGTGKSTVARKVAEKMQFAFFDTGATYRAIAWYLLQNDANLDDLDQIASLLPKFTFRVEDDTQKKRYFVQDHEVTEVIRTPKVTEASSKVSAYAIVRKLAWTLQRDFAEHKDAVFEGRDLGTVVFPDAEVKIFLTASPEVRAMRRSKELQTQFPAQSVSHQEVLKKMRERDTNDSTRTLAPLKKAEDAVAIDTSELTVDQVVEMIVTLTRRRR